MDKKKIFITRDLDPDGDFVARLEACGFKLSGTSMLVFEGIPIKALPPTDWIFFYSRNAVRFFQEGLQSAELKLAPTVRLAAMGPGTAETLQECFGRVDFIGNGAPKAVAEAFLEVSIRQRVLFPRALHSRKSVQQQLGSQIEAVDLVVYENRPKSKPEITLPEADILIFTSPLNAEVYFQNSTLNKGQVVIAMGASTLKMLSTLVHSPVHVPEYPTEEGLVLLLKQLL